MVDVANRLSPTNVLTIENNDLSGSSLSTSSLSNSELSNNTTNTLETVPLLNSTIHNINIVALTTNNVTNEATEPRANGLDTRDIISGGNSINTITTVTTTTASYSPHNGVCRPPPSRKFAHPCYCPPYVGSHLYDPISERCLTTTSQRSRLLRECSRHLTCNQELVCDVKKSRCNCRPGLHLYYETNTTFGCLPYNETYCNKGFFFNTNTKGCQKAFDIGELQASFQPVLSATQFSFVSIVLLWILLLILILTAKLRKLRAIHTVRQSSVAHRRSNHHQHHASHLLNPFMSTASEIYNRDSERHSLALSLEEANLNDELFFAMAGNEHFNHADNLQTSQRSLNNPPPRFEDIYPDRRRCTSSSSFEHLPSYEEALYMQKHSTQQHQGVSTERQKDAKGTNEIHVEPNQEIHEPNGRKSPPSNRTMV